MDRRAFLESMAAFTAGIMLPAGAAGQQAVARDRLGELLPQRSLGRTGRQVTMLGLGGWHIGQMSEREAQATLEAALEGGVRFFDSAESYQGGGSESRLGRLLTPKYRDVAFLMTKSEARTGAEAQRDLDDSLKRLNTDYLDLWQVHAINSAEDVDARFDQGVIDIFARARESGKVRHIGFTGHRDPAAHLRMLERTDVFETCQMPVNLADPSYLSFIDNVLPVLVERNLGVLAMKSLANGGFFGGQSHGRHGDRPRVVPARVSVPQAIHFVWSLPVSTLISGPDDAAMFREKVALARSFRGMGEKERRALVARVADLATGNGVEFYKRG